MHTTKRRIAIITNNPPPYRIPIFNAVADEDDLEVVFVFSTMREPDRAWDLSQIRFKQHYLKERYIGIGGKFIHLNFDVITFLREFKPELVMVNGFNPTYVLACLYALKRKLRLALFIDGTVFTEGRLSWAHRMVRRFLYPRISIFIGPSKQTMALYASYGVSPTQMHTSHLCADNDLFMSQPERTRDVDLIFCGRFVPEKHPLFALDVAAELARRLKRRVSMLMVGSGPLDEVLRERAANFSDLVAVEFPGFARQAELPGHYLRAKVSLFPTSSDAWGVVANEACASGVPVIVSPQAGVAHELVRDNETGHVLDMDVASWAVCAERMLTNEAQWGQMSRQCREAVKPYSFENAAKGLVAGIRAGLP
ncbi:glycosyltransferase family 4 protein [Aquabacterium sp. CECT 9606]|uniref:glycosyltransferase family 4 protein n=1 Tax=Aquabacterium sp. CECT 9606 TaxID=2845822 RepID=UPI001E41E171|nr:glycosyltransferase family 4 protein [Aquabacterium sp. CECT 9606]CAH0351863.1 D-inositol-3-phosphate glycosyltransferase [Aquabacterium sp. CECT 9606]